MAENTPSLTVFYDGACPRCVKDRRRFEQMARNTGTQVQWLDITGRDEELQQLGIDPHAALTELHVQDASGHILRELDAYIALMRHVPRLKPLAWLIGLPLIRPALAHFYHWSVQRRLRRQGRL